ncbi:hypothetical protein P170DRAFT_479117 [Aspergillus steynii IBT 23096]|uniref:Uncharacterized protein n=1 Tax=Aspergillus steynii IBT 23096 TaxID=1392250 RepID=A0A2I2FZZ5_9EURO|nr:uncharacterized protein P170DRAFT_479117 [Aspergillus steynii IBT 23096]PLB46201.1 hypothetical protein P170DRAFT_479117 [Aspergillus steynii IBT 23096]
MAADRDLRTAVENVILALQGLPGWQSRRIAVVGGVCVKHHVHPEPRETNDLDLMIESPIDTSEVKSALVAASPHQFEMAADVFLFKVGTRRIQVDIMSQLFIFPWNQHEDTFDEHRFPPQAISINMVQINRLPFLSLQDMVAIKAYSCGTRMTIAKNVRDANDCWELAMRLPQGVIWDIWHLETFANGIFYLSEYSKHHYRNVDAWAIVLQLPIVLS